MTFETVVVVISKEKGDKCNYTHFVSHAAQLFRGDSHVKRFANFKTHHLTAIDIGWIYTRKLSENKLGYNKRTNFLT